MQNWVIPKLQLIKTELIKSDSCCHSNPLQTGRKMFWSQYFGFRASYNCPPTMQA